MISSAWDRARRVHAAVSLLAVLTVVACVLVLSVGMTVPEPWWPRTGRAVTVGAGPVRHDPCARIVGPAKVYCKSSITHSDAVGACAGAWRLVPAGTGLAALAMWRRRSAAGQRRR